MKILIKNCYLVSVDSKRKEIEENMDILIENDTIAKIEKNINEKVDKIINAENKIVMPGLINTHAHVPMSIFRETLDGYTLQDWLNKKIWPMEDKLTDEDVYYASYLSFLEMIKTGCTTINDMYFMTENIIKACEETKVRLQTSVTLRDILSDEQGKELLNQLKNIVKKYKNNNRLSFNAGIHSMYTASNKYIDECIDYAKESNIHVHMHFCENDNEIKDVINFQKDKPINVLLDKFKNIKTILAHCVSLSKEDILKFKDLDVSVAHCPVSNLKLGCGIADISYMFENNINVSLGTDGQGTGSNLDLFETMKYTYLLQKGLYKDPTKFKAFDIIKMATINGAKALNLDSSIGSIEVNKKADIIILDTSSILVNPKNDILSQIVNNIKGTDVLTTIIDGNILMENRILKDKKEFEIVSKCEKIFERLSK